MIDAEEGVALRAVRTAEDVGRIARDSVLTIGESTRVEPLGHTFQGGGVCGLQLPTAPSGLVHVEAVGHRTLVSGDTGVGPDTDLAAWSVCASEAAVSPGVMGVFPLVADRCGRPVGAVACQVAVPRRPRLPTVVGLLEQHELAARRRVDDLREEAVRIQAELAAAEEERQERVIARQRVDTVLAPDSAADASPRGRRRASGGGQAAGVAIGTHDCDTRAPDAR